ncbi:hypothetical protein EU805_16500 [Salipiger sp. IMCC34102]|nr:hypothetical protein EU805_16500 [Salipiger sp. IMCC34102]
MTEKPSLSQSERFLLPVSPVPKLRAFQPYYRERVLCRIAAAFGLASTDELPPYFLVEFILPAKIGLRKDLENRFGPALGQEAEKRRRLAMRGFFDSFQYHQAVIQCEDRICLDLAPSGRVTADERAYSMRFLGHLKRRHLRRGQGGAL